MKLRVGRAEWFLLYREIKGFLLNPGQLFLCGQPSEHGVIFYMNFASFAIPFLREIG
ncbi:MAG TPA: hypothetical protein VN939_02080 [Chthoniobacterales bacterium]|jgi:hypothetical protein|nr:hypothetical protein [Chthoniobacterales bacterium]